MKPSFSLFGPHSRFSGWTPKKVDRVIEAVEEIANGLDRIGNVLDHMYRYGDTATEHYPRKYDLEAEE